MNDTNPVDTCFDKSIISIKEARKILGNDARGCSDEMIECLIIGLDNIAIEYFKLVPSVIIVKRKKGLE